MEDPATAPPPSGPPIRLRKVRVNNLKDVDLDIQQGELLLFCGLSGSGKSSLAFDTLYAEGQRRFIECLSPQTRQFVSQLDKPDAEMIAGVPAAIAVQAFRGNVHRLTTIGNATEIADHLNLLFAEIGVPYCPQCDTQITVSSPQAAADQLEQRPPDCRFMIVFKTVPTGSCQEALIEARKQGYSRVILDDMLIDLAALAFDSSDQLPAEASEFRVVVDRLKTGQLNRQRLTESLELAFQAGSGTCEVWLEAAPPEVPPDHWNATSRTIADRPWWVIPFSRKPVCSSCGLIVPRAEPTLFNHRTSTHACARCEGTGHRDKWDREICPECHGYRLGALSSAYRVHWIEATDDDPSEQSASYGQLMQLPVHQLADVMTNLNLSEYQAQATRWIRQQIDNRLKFLRLVGLDYLSLNRSVRSISHGEAQRVSLTSCLSSTLVGTLYVLDEPSVGLHHQDLPPLIEAIQQLHQRGNTIVLVDHDETMIRQVPRIVELGPAAGPEGGNIVFDGSPEALQSQGDTVTADFLAGRRGVSFGEDQRRPPRGWLKLLGARGNNLKGINVEFPLGCLTVVTGVSGSGKSTLVQDTLYGAVCQRKEQPCDPPLPFEEVIGDGRFDEIVLVDRSPIGRSSRSNPVTYVKAFDEIRRCFADTVDARTYHMNVSRFSFNAAGGRCDKCEGAGQLSIDMQFMPPVDVVCDACRGTRYKDEVLSVKYRGKSIAEVLQMTTRQAFSFFRGQPKVQAKLKALIDVGLDYIQLGQPATKLSSGEAQRLKLASYLNLAKSKRALFLLDEPTTGLHMADVTRLLDCFDSLLAVGHSLIVVEHHLRLIKSADWIIDLGPAAGERGGQVVAAGPPEQVQQVEASATGQALLTQM